MPEKTFKILVLIQSGGRVKCEQTYYKNKEEDKIQSVSFNRYEKPYIFKAWLDKLMDVSVHIGVGTLNGDLKIVGTYEESSYD